MVHLVVIIQAPAEQHNVGPKQHVPQQHLNSASVRWLYLALFVVNRMFHIRAIWCITSKALLQLKQCESRSERDQGAGTVKLGYMKGHSVSASLDCPDICWIERGIDNIFTVKRIQGVKNLCWLLANSYCHTSVHGIIKRSTHDMAKKQIKNQHVIRRLLIGNAALQQSVSTAGLLL